MVAHETQLQQHGGGIGIRDESLLESALMRPQDLALYGQPDLANCAAAYAAGIIKNHFFADGNKRTGFVAAIALIRLHGFTLNASMEQCLMMTVRLAAGNIDEETYADWIRANIQELGR